jgi:hypothetical protein
LMFSRTNALIVACIVFLCNKKGSGETGMNWSGVNQIDSYLFSAESKKKMDIILIYPKIKINLRREKNEKIQGTKFKTEKKCFIFWHMDFLLLLRLFSSVVS